MKLTPAIKHFLEQENIRYCKQLGIKKPYPVLLFTVREVYKLDSDLIRFKPKQKDGLSVFNDKERHTYINVKQHKVVADLIDTIVHELVHIRFPKLKHGKEFQQYVDNVIMGCRF